MWQVSLHVCGLCSFTRAWVIGIVVAAYSSLLQLFQFGINMNTMIICASNNIHFSVLYYAIPFRAKVRIPAAQFYDCFVQIPASRRKMRDSGIRCAIFGLRAKVRIPRLRSACNLRLRKFLLRAEHMFYCL